MREGSSDDLAAAIEDDRLRRLYRYWDAKRAGRRFPARADIDPLDLAYVLGWLVMIDVFHSPLRFRIRLYGTRIAEEVGTDYTGRFLDECAPSPYTQFLKTVWTELVAQGKPMHGFYEETIDNLPRRFESLRLPLSSDGKTIDMILAGVADLT